MKHYIPDYPRPQLVRTDWVNLNGKWDFAFDDAVAGEKLGWQKGFTKQYDIEVPFTYETKLSGIGIQEPHEHIWYQKTLNVKKHDGRVLLHFEGSDYHTRAFVNGQFVGEHFGGYARFTFDITNFVNEGENQLVVHIEDSFSRNQPRGKQRWIPENFSCFYVQTTGIWKSVWLEYAPETYIKSLKITPQMESESVRIEAEISSMQPGMVVEAVASFKDKEAGRTTVSVKDGLAVLEVGVECRTVHQWGVMKWSPNNPNLYDLDLTLSIEGETLDTVGSYFGMREVSIKGDRVLLNGAVLYQRLILDQGYWKDSDLTPPSEAALIEDIDKIMALGYNGVRKHMKVEDERFLYWADVKGLLVWSEFPATYTFTDEAVQNFTREWMEVVRQNYSHPAIITWTPFNESWGVPMIDTDKTQQKFTESIYYLTKSFDAMRPVITNDGWRHTISDIVTLHDYEESGEFFLKYYTEHKDAFLENERPYHAGGQFYAFADGYKYQGQPIIISEYGGIAF
ncbi:MAG: glycoside hydrolase family 2, partial [Clostridia bacterium]|nr:glycoside hydrolase family 2 [Clostridia bacterium]